MPTPYYQSESVTLYHGDCREVLPTLMPVEVALISDPPYGCLNNCDYTRFSGGLSPSKNYHEGIHGDNEPFDPSPFLDFKWVALFGYQFFAERLPLGTILVWNKKRDSQLGTFLSDCELVWVKGNKGCYLFKHVWHGFDRQSERGKSVHPSQKPIDLMRWIFEMAKVPKDAIVLDPFAGSGTTLLAARAEGRRAIGIELSEEYCEIIAKRLDATAEIQMELLPC